MTSVNYVRFARLNLRASSGNHSRVMRRPGKQKVYYENLRLSLEAGTFDKIESAKYPYETRLDFIRVAIKNELQRRRELEKKRSNDKLS